MKRMGFTADPGPLPFWTVRRQQWANRTWVDELIEVHGEHGCGMPPTAAKVAAIQPYDEFLARGLPNPYPAGTALVMLKLVEPPDRWVKEGETWRKLAAP